MTVMRVFILSALLCVCSVSVLTSPSQVWGSTINPGDLVVGNILAPGGPSNLVLVNPIDGSQTILSSAVSFPSGLAFASNGSLFVTDLNANAVVQIDPATGSSHTISSGGSLMNPLGLAVGSTGDLFV